MTRPSREEAIKAIREFIGAEPQKGRNAFFASLDSSGSPSFRQISTYIEGWTVYTVSQARSLKLKHLRRDPRASYLWIEDRPERRRKMVWLRGTCEIIEDPDEVAAFMERRATTLGYKVPERDWHRMVIKFTPDYLRAETFLGEEAGNEPVIIKNDEFTSL
jgi:general stress protein 26